VIQEIAPVLSVRGVTLLYGGLIIWVSMWASEVWSAAAVCMFVGHSQGKLDGTISYLQVEGGDRGVSCWRSEKYILGTQA